MPPRRGGARKSRHGKSPAIFMSTPKTWHAGSCAPRASSSHAMKESAEVAHSHSPQPERSPDRIGVFWRRIAEPVHPCSPLPARSPDRLCEELLKGNRRNYKKINRRDPVSVVVKEGPPCLRWSTSPRYHVLRGCRLGDVEAELQKLAVDMRRTPERVLKAHSLDKVAHLFVDLRSAAERTGFPSPERTEAFAMPIHDRLRSDNRYGIKDARKAAVEPNEQRAIDPGQT